MTVNPNDNRFVPPSLDFIRELSEQQGQAVSGRQYTTTVLDGHKGLRMHTELIEMYGSWNEVLLAAGVETTPLEPEPQPPSEQDCIEAMREAVRGSGNLLLSHPLYHIYCREYGQDRLLDAAAILEVYPRGSWKQLIDKTGMGTPGNYQPVTLYDVSPERQVGCVPAHRARMQAQHDKQSQSLDTLLMQMQYVKNHRDFLQLVLKDNLVKPYHQEQAEKNLLYWQANCDYIENAISALVGSQDALRAVPLTDEEPSSMQVSEVPEDKRSA